MKYIKPINEIGDASAKKFRYKGPSPAQILAILDKAYNSRENQSWSDQKSMTWEFSTENADYIVNIYYSVNAYLTLNLSRKKSKVKPRRRQLNGGLGFSVKADKKEDRERVTNFGEHFRVLATVCDIFVDFINTVADDYILNNVYMIPKAENDETEDTDNQRGRFYEPYIKKQIKRIKRKVTVQNTTIKTDDGTVVGGFVLKDGHQYTMGGKRHKEFRNEQFNEAESRDPRKKGEHRGSSSHSDLYTDEDPKGTIHGLGFKDAQKAEDSIKIIKKVDRTHAHKVQATLVMQQRAKVAIERTKDPEKKKNLKAAYEIWTKFLEEMKKKTQELKKESVVNEIGDLSAGFYRVTGPLFDAGGRRYCKYEFTTESKLRYSVVFYDSVKDLTEMWFETYDGDKQIPMHLTTDRGEILKVIGTAIGILEHYLTAEGAGAPYGITDNRTPNQIHNPGVKTLIIKPVKEKKRRGRGFGDDIESDRRREKIYMQFLKKQGFSPKLKGSDILIDIEKYQKKEGKVGVVAESWTGQEVADHIKYITPEDSDIPDYFIDKYVLPNDGWQNKPIKLKNLLKDRDFKDYYKSGEERYDEYEVSGDDLYQELVVYRGQLLDGYSRAARMLRNGEKTAAAFVIENRYVMNMELFERYTKLDSVSNQLLKDCFRQWVLDFERGEKSSSYSFSVENPGLTFDLDCSIYFKGKGFEVLDSTGADARDEDDDGDWQDPFINIDFACNPEWLPTYWSEVYFNLADVLRHEIEHITQDGVDAGNYRKGKPNQPDDYMRGMIKQGIIPKYYYLLLPKEVDANLQGLRFEAKKRREKLIDACNRYLDIKVEMGYITPEEKEEVLIKWEARAKHLGFKLR